MANEQSGLPERQSIGLAPVLDGTRAPPIDVTGR